MNWAPSHDPKIGTYVNGVYLGRPQGGVFDFLDINRVEVLRGAQGTLFGRNTTAGLVHVISNRPTDEFDYSVGAGIGNDNAAGSRGCSTCRSTTCWPPVLRFSTGRPTATSGIPAPARTGATRTR